MRKQYRSGTRSDDEERYGRGCQTYVLDRELLRRDGYLRHSLNERARIVSTLETRQSRNRLTDDRERRLK